jgi:hypothetical protein
LKEGRKERRLYLKTQPRAGKRESEAFLAREFEKVEKEREEH